MKKILVICSTLDLDLPYGATPALWQLLKALYEQGCEIIVIPYLGKSINSLWWRCYENPVRAMGDVYLNVRNLFKTSNFGGGYITKLARPLILRNWKKLLHNILDKEEIDFAFFFHVPLNQMVGLAETINGEYGVPTIYYEVDLPTSLPEYGGFSISHFNGADLSEYDLFLIASEGCKKKIEEMGANRVELLHFGVDPSVFAPIEIEKSIDVMFSGLGSKGREEYITELVSKPSLHTDYKFVVSGQWYSMDMGRAKVIPPVPFSSWRNYCCGSKINLSITRKPHSIVYGSSISRPFELAAMGCCVVSSEHRGIEQWLKPKEEIIIVNDSSEAIETYKWLLSDDEERKRIATNARRRVLKDHTFQNRAKELLDLARQL